MSKASFKSKNGESSSQYRKCVPPCPRYITSGDTHSLYVVCLGVKHAESALEGAGCPHCERLTLRTLRSQRTLFEEGVFASAPQGAGPASAEAERRLHSWVSQLDLAEGMETGGSLSLSSPARSTVRSLGSERLQILFKWFNLDSYYPLPDSMYNCALSQSSHVDCQTLICVNPWPDVDSF